ncbi:D-aminoacyl-tRNA deacylase [Flavobacteriaceae bacterium M23B6Z8]
MRVVIQRVSSAKVEVENKTVSQITTGMLILLGIENDDTEEDIDWLVRKISGLRIFNDTSGYMNLSLNEVEGDVIVVSQFTLHASVKKGNRPSFIRAAKPPVAIPMYEAFIKGLEQALQKKVGTGVFGADMKVHLVNDGPVTIHIDSKHRE